ncbi:MULTISPECIES: carbohydrate kinase family protein [unclassified Streptomyces]|uniref:carbohydrate kinase family protein n=1 Tax=unclassified Streptomyces TaxID=2593676 RepID=UPI0033A30F12
MRIAVTGSLATDHLMTFPGRFTDQLLADRLDHISLSFLVDTLEIRAGGAAADLASGLARLGHRPLLVGAVGADFAPYGQRLSALGVDLSGVQVSPTRPTARLLRTTDRDGHQIASFHAGAMTEAAGIDLAAVLRRAGGAGLVLIGADDPAAMLRHTRACRTHGIRFAADPAQQLTRLDGTRIRELVDGADHLFTDAHDHALLLAKTGWTREDVLRRVGVWVTTLGEKGIRVERAHDPVLEIPAVPDTEAADPTGTGAAFRAGYLAALAEGEDTVRCARSGSAPAAQTLSRPADPARLHALTRAAYGTEEHR